MSAAKIKEGGTRFAIRKLRMLRLQIRGVGLGQKTSTPIKLRALSSKNIGPSHS